MSDMSKIELHVVFVYILLSRYAASCFCQASPISEIFMKYFLRYTLE